MKVLFLVALVLGLFVGCSDDELNEDTEEQLCSAATGDWSVSSVTCSGTTQTAVATKISFDQTANTITQNRGDADCVSTSVYSSIFGFSANLELTGSGNLSCFQNGSSVSSCTGSSNSCNSSTSINGIENDYDQCVVFNGTSIEMTRTVTAQHVTDSVTLCAAGETEVVTLSPPSSSTATLTISDGPTHDYGYVSTGGSLQKTFTVTNSGTTSASSLAGSGLAAPFSFTGGSYPGTGGTCAATLAGSATCTLVVDFSPTATGLFTDSIELSYNDGSSVQSTTRSIQGTGTSASLALLSISETDPYDYGTIAIGGTSSHTFTLTNSGAGTATSLSESGLSAPFSFLGGSYPGTGGTCGATLSAASSCDLVIEFSPTATGVQSDTINLNYNNGASAQVATRDIQGIGAAPGLLIVSDGPIFDFGNVSTGGSSNKVFTVTNTGGMIVTSISGSGLAAPYVFTGGAYPGTSGTCTSTLTPASNCDIDVTFAPLSTGTFNDSIQIDYNNGASAQSTTRNITGAGI